MCCALVSVFFLKQNTAYDVRISDWSSDVCSSDLDATAFMAADPAEALRHEIAAGRPSAEQRRVAIAVRLAESVAAGGQRDGLFMVHRHALERRLDVARRPERIGIVARSFWLDVDQAHLESGGRRTGAR